MKIFNFKIPKKYKPVLLPEESTDTKKCFRIHGMLFHVENKNHVYYVYCNSTLARKNIYQTKQIIKYIDLALKVVGIINEVIVDGYELSDAFIESLYDERYPEN